MTLLHMDVDHCRTTATRLRESKSQIDQSTVDLLAKIDQMVGHTWVAPGADQYRANFQTWNTGVRQLLTELDALSTALATEVDRWEQVASSI